MCGFPEARTRVATDAEFEARAHAVRMAFKAVIAGGGVAGLEATIALRALAQDAVSIELVSPVPEFTYRPMVVAEPFGRGRVHRFDLAAVARECGATLRLAGLERVDASSAQAILDDGATLGYDALLIACGTTHAPAVPCADTFRGPADVEMFRKLLVDADTTKVRSLVFIVPHGTVWPLPLYELALMTAVRVSRRPPSLTIVTSEEGPLDVLGPAASRAVSDLLAEHGIAVQCGAYPIAVKHGRLSLAPTGSVQADRFVALPLQRGITVPGAPRTPTGFIPVDEHARVVGLECVFAAGDITDYPVKQGGVAAQQADAAAECIAAEAGAAILPTPFRPVLRTVLLTGDGPRYLSSRLRDGAVSSVATSQPFWSPADKIAAPFLAPYLARAVSEKRARTQLPSPGTRSVH